MELKVESIYKLIYYFTTNDRATVINEIAEFIDEQGEMDEVKLENIEKFINERKNRRDNGTKYDNNDNDV